MKSIGPKHASRNPNKWSNSNISSIKKIIVPKIMNSIFGISFFTFDVSYFEKKYL